VYERLAARGRMLPAGLVYLDSWVDADRLDRCFQLMETDDPSLFAAWLAQWDDLAECEVVPVISSAEARDRVVG
jgi:glutathione S-transferase